jgi:predicted nucleic acid-binding protein
LHIGRDPRDSPKSGRGSPARVVRAMLVTNNVKHFEKVKGLSVKNWVG